MENTTHKKRLKPQHALTRTREDRSRGAKPAKADSEKLIEKKLREGVRKLGGKAYKLVSPGCTGVPDRLVVLPGGRTLFVELKSTGEKPTPRQRAVHRELNGLGCDVWVIDTVYQVGLFLEHAKSLIC